MERLSIAISSKNRWNALEQTLVVLAERLPEVPVYLVDDGSDAPCAYDPNSLHPNLRLTSHETSTGYIQRRNEIAQNATTPYVMSLDDDSFPMDGDLPGALDLLDASPDVLCLSMPIFNPPTDSFQNPIRGSEPSPCRAFIGCAHIMRRDAFLALGAYNAKLWHQGEEMDLAARGILQGLRCLHYPGAIIHHMESNEGRSWNSMDFHGARNAVLWNDWYVPDSQQRYRRMRRSVATLGHALKTRRLGQLRGHMAAVGMRASLSEFRHRFDTALYERWMALPFA